MRNATIDGMKGVGIILVVVYHAVSVNVPGARELFTNGLYNVIASFFMQLFMVVSGYLAYGKLSNKEWVTSRVIRCAVPTLVFTIIFWFFTRAFHVETYDLPLLEYLLFTFVVGYNGLVVWYLWTLMFCYLVGYVLELLPKKVPMVGWFLLAFAVMNLLPLNLLGFGFLKWYGIFFFMGYLIKSGEKYNLKFLPYLSLLLFPFYVYMTDWMKPYQNLTYGMTGYVNLIGALAHGELELAGVTFIMAVMGVCFVYSLVSLVKWQPLVFTLAYIGRASIGVFLLHYFFVGVFHNVIISTLFSLCVSLALYEGLKRIKVTNLVLFGGTDIPMRLSEKIYSAGEA